MGFSYFHLYKGYSRAVTSVKRHGNGLAAHCQFDSDCVGVDAGWCACWAPGHGFPLHFSHSRLGHLQPLHRLALTPWILQLRRYRLKQRTICSFCVSVLLVRSFISTGLIMDLKILPWGLDNAPLNCDWSLSSCEKFVHKVLSNPTHIMQRDLSNCPSHVTTRPIFLLIQQDSLCVKIPPTVIWYVSWQAGIVSQPTAWASCQKYSNH